MKVLVESILPVDTPRFGIRIWKQEDKLDSINWEESNAITETVYALSNETGEPLGLCQAILKLDHVNAVEVRRRFSDGSLGAGCVAYRDWT